MSGPPMNLKRKAGTTNMRRWMFPLLLPLAVFAAGCAYYRTELPKTEVSMPKKLAPVGSSASSQESDDVRSAMAFDGDMKTRWASTHTDNQWIMADLGSDRTVIGVRMTWETAFAEEYRVEGSLDGQDWSRIASVRNGDGEEDRLEFSPVTLRYLRIYGVRRGSQWGFSLYELEIWGL